MDIRCKFLDNCALVIKNSWNCDRLKKIQTIYASIFLSIPSKELLENIAWNHENCQNWAKIPKMWTVSTRVLHEKQNCKKGTTTGLCSPPGYWYVFWNICYTWTILATLPLSSIAGGMKSVLIFTLIVNGFVSIVWNSQNCHFVRRKDNLKGTIERPLESRAVK